MMDNMIFSESLLSLDMIIEAKHLGKIQFLVLFLLFCIQHSASATQCQKKVPGDTPLSSSSARSYFSIMSIDTIITLIFIIIVVIIIMINYFLLMCINLFNQQRQLQGSKDATINKKKKNIIVCNI